MRVINFVYLFSLFVFHFISADEKFDLKIREFFVIVEFEVGKNDSVFFDKEKTDEYQDYYDNHKKVKVPGIPINENTVLINHIMLAPYRIENIKILTGNGDEIEGSLDGYDLQRDVQTIHCKKNIKPTLFKNQNLSKLPKPLFESIVLFREITPYILTKEISGENEAVPFYKKEENIYPIENIDSHQSVMAILTNKNGEPVGIQTKSFYRLQNKVSVFSPKEIKTISLDNLEEKFEKISQKIHNQIYFIKINFRQNAEENNLDNISSPQIVNENATEVKLFGILINKNGDIIVPSQISLKKVTEIESIEIHLPNKILQANFKGSFATVGAIIINCDELKNKTTNIQMNSPSEEQLILTTALRWQTPEDYQLEIILDRLNSRIYEFNNKKSYLLKSSTSINEVLFLNIDLEIIGINTNYLNPLITENEANQYSYSPWEVKHLSFNDIKNELTALEEFFDKRAVLQNRQDAATPTWLGVLVQSPSSALLEYLKISDKTKNGTIGLLVTHVYKNSPATKIGLKPLDVLISVTPEDTGREVEFTKQQDYNNTYYGFDGANLDSQELLIPPIRNEVTNILNNFEINKTATLKFIRDGKIQSSTFVLEKAPKDFNNANKAVDDDLGIHVKDITFDVRDAMHMKDTDNGIIISQVEQGKAVNIAQIREFFIITKIDNSPITSAAQFKELINEKKSKGQNEFSFSVLFLGKASLIKVSLNN